MQGKHVNILRRTRRTAREQRGALLMEALIGIFVLSVLGTAVLAAMSTVQRSGANTRSEAIAESIARNQMERITSGTFPVSLPYTFSGGELVSTPSDYAVAASASEYQSGVATIVQLSVTVSFIGTDLFTLDSVWLEDPSS